MTGANGLSSGGRAALVSELRKLAVKPGRAAAGPEEQCDLCRSEIPTEHRHLLHIEERRIVCVCAACAILLGGNGPYRPTGTRTVPLDDLDLPDEIWSGFRIPIGLAFLFESSAVGRVVGLYPSPAGATECELDLDAWEDLVTANPVLADLEPDCEALIVNRLADPPRYAIVPIDQCYRLVGMVRVAWQGISGGPAVDAAVEGFFAEIAGEAAT